MTAKKKIDKDDSDVTSTKSVSQETNFLTGTNKKETVSENEPSLKKNGKTKHRSKSNLDENTPKGGSNIPLKTSSKVKKRRKKSGNHQVKMAQRLRMLRQNETPAQREARLLNMKERARQRLANENQEEREERLARLRILARTRTKNQKLKQETKVPAGKRAKKC